MPVENTESYSYYSISREGKIRSTSGPDKGEQYDTIWGNLVGIDLMTDEYEGEKIMKWHFKLEDPEHSKVEILQVGEASSAARGIIMSLVSIEGNVHQVKFSPYRSSHGGKEYTNCAVYHRYDETAPFDKTPKWSKQMMDGLPDVEEIQLSDRKVFDDGPRRIYIRQLAAHVKKQKLNLRKEQTTEKVDEDTGEVLNPDPAQAAYGEPPAHVKQQPEEIHNFEDIDDTLPF